MPVLKSTVGLRDEFPLENEIRSCSFGFLDVMCGDENEVSGTVEVGLVDSGSWPDQAFLPRSP